jgi:hypothetical protein
MFAHLPNSWVKETKSRKQDQIILLVFIVISLSDERYLDVRQLYDTSRFVKNRARVQVVNPAGGCPIVQLISPSHYILEL